MTAERRRGKATWLCAAGAVACPLTLLTPWFTTGTDTRSGYAFLQALAGSGLERGPVAGLLRVAVLALPVLAALAVASVLVGARWACWTASTLSGLVLVALSVSVLWHAHGGGPWGPWLGTSIGMPTALLAARQLVRSPSRGPWR